MEAKKKAIIVSGYFNPIHKGHLELFELAKKAADKLWVIVNSDKQRELKGSKEFMDENERLEIVKAIRYVDYALISQDTDKTQCETLKHFTKLFEGFTLCFIGILRNQSVIYISNCFHNL